MHPLMEVYTMHPLMKVYTMHPLMEVYTMNPPMAKLALFLDLGVKLGAHTYSGGFP